MDIQPAKGALNDNGPEYSTDSVELWEGVMSGSRNIARTAVLFEAATALHALYPAFDLSAFKDHLLGEKGKHMFKSDLQEAKYLNISRLPTLIIRRRDGSIVMLQGYQSYESLCKAIGMEA